MNWSAVVDTYYKSSLKPGDVKIIPRDDFMSLPRVDTIMVVLSVKWLTVHQTYRFTMLTPEGILIRERQYDKYYDKHNQ